MQSLCTSEEPHYRDEKTFKLIMFLKVLLYLMDLMEMVETTDAYDLVVGGLEQTLWKYHICPHKVCQAQDLLIIA